MVAKQIVPLISLCRLILIPFLNFGMISLPPIIDTDCGILNDCLSYFDLYLGNLDCFLKKLPYAVSKFFREDCKELLKI